MKNKLETLEDGDVDLSCCKPSEVMKVLISQLNDYSCNELAIDEYGNSINLHELTERLQEFDRV